MQPPVIPQSLRIRCELACALGLDVPSTTSADVTSQTPDRDANRLQGLVLDALQAMRQQVSQGATVAAEQISRLPERQVADSLAAMQLQLDGLASLVTLQHLNAQPWQLAFAVRSLHLTMDGVYLPWDAGTASCLTAALDSKQDPRFLVELPDQPLLAGQLKLKSEVLHPSTKARILYGQYCGFSEVDLRRLRRFVLLRSR